MVGFLRGVTWAARRGGGHREPGLLHHPGTIFPGDNDLSPDESRVIYQSKDEKKMHPPCLFLRITNGASQSARRNRLTPMETFQQPAGESG